MSADAAGRISTGIEGLDAVLGGGLARNRIYLVEGHPGSGKTTLGLQFMREGIAQGESVLYVTLSETRDELADVARSHGWTLEGMHVHELLPTADDLLPDAQMRMFHPSEVELSDTTRVILDRITEHAPTRVVFDSLSEMRMLAQNPLRYRRHILALKQFFIGRKCTVLLLDDKTAEITDLQLHSLAHGVISLENLAQQYGTERRRLRVLKMRGAELRGGYHDFVIRRGGLRVFPRLVAAEHRSPFGGEPLRAGIEGLDRLLGGGVDRGTSTLIVGPAGSGKSSIALQYALSGAARAERVAYFAFDENLATMRARARGLGMNLDALQDEGRIVVRQVDPAEVSPGEFAHGVRAMVDREKLRIVVIDSLNGYLAAMPEERFLTLHLHELLTYLGQQGVVTFLVMAQHGLLGANMQTPVDTSYLADAVILLRFFEAGGKVKRAVSVIKKRSGQHEDLLREFALRPDGLWVGEPLEQFHGVLTGTPQFIGAARHGGDAA